MEYIDSITVEELEKLKRLLNINFSNISGNDVKIKDEGGFYTSDRLEAILQEIGGGGVKWDELTYTSVFGVSTASTSYATVKENTDGAGYFSVIGFLSSPTDTRALIYKITVDGTVICNGVTMITAEAGLQAGSPIIPAWYRFNTSYKVEHKLNGDSAIGYTTVHEATE